MLPMKMAYADPPYPGKAWMYKSQASYRGEVDHRALVSSLQLYDGWAISTSEAGLCMVLSLCKELAEDPGAVHVCPWTKPIGAASTTRGMHNTWEPLIVKPGRELQPGFRDWLSTPPAKDRANPLIGRKPLKFCTFLFRCLGLCAGDELADLYPGTGIVGRAWREASSNAGVDVSSTAEPDTSPIARANG